MRRPGRLGGVLRPRSGPLLRLRSPSPDSGRGHSPTDQGGRGPLVNPAIAESRLRALERYLSKLEAFGATPLEDFLQNEDLRLAAERCLHLAIECVLDLAHHVIADLGCRSPSSYADAFTVLCEERLISEELCRSLQKSAGMRNVLVHEYLGIDHALVHHALGSPMDDLREFARIVVDLMEQ